MSKFTAGPYHLGFAKSGARYIYASAEQPMKPNVRVNKSTTPEIVANATLFAASWDMHDALLQAEYALAMSYQVCDYPANGNSTQDHALAAVRAALAKAEIAP